MRVLFLSPVPVEGAGCRARIIQYLPYLKAAGISAVVRPFMGARFFRIAYQPGRWGAKLAYFLAAIARRWITCGLESLRCDVVYIYRECAPLGPPVFEWLLLRLGKPIVYDMDDAIHLPSDHEQFRGRFWTWLKWYPKVPWILRRSTHAVVGNAYLKAYAARLAPRVTVLPTPEEPGRFPAARTSSDGRLRIGWIGTHSTASYLTQLADVFQELSRRYDFELRVIGAGRPVVIPDVRVANLGWSMLQEAQMVRDFDIGVYPLSGSTFDQGKACYKAILYMAAGVPVVASSHGANRDIIQHGENGLLAESRDAWLQQLSALLEQPALRERLIEGGRRTVAERYTVARVAPVLIGILTQARGSRGSSR